MVPDALLDDIYAAIVARGDYACPLAALSQLFGSHSGAVLRLDEDGLRFVKISGLCPTIMADYNREHYKYDPWFNAEGDRPPTAITIGSRLVDPKTVEKSAFHEDVLEPHDIWDILNTKIGTPPGPVIYYTFYRPRGRVFEPQHARRFGLVAKHIARAHALRLMVKNEADAPDARLDSFRLTTKERKVCELLLEGLSNAEIADAARISANTLKWHLRNIFDKAGVGSRAAFIVKAHGRPSAPGRDAIV